MVFCPRFLVAFHRIAEKDMTKPPRNVHLAAPATDPCQGPQVPTGLHTKGDMGPLGTARSLGSHQGGGRTHRRAPCQWSTDGGARAASEGARWGPGAPQAGYFLGGRPSPLQAQLQKKLLPEVGSVLTPKAPQLLTPGPCVPGTFQGRRHSEL